GLGLRFALLTAARVSEIAGLCRAELHLERPTRAYWEVPGARTKNGRDHVIPLSPLALATVRELLGMIEPDMPWVCATRSHQRKGPIRGNSLTQAMANLSTRIAAEKKPQRGASTWNAEQPTPHDLRRTVETRMAQLRISQEYRDRCLNHLPDDVGSKHY